MHLNTVGVLRRSHVPCHDLSIGSRQNDRLVAGSPDGFVELGVLVRFQLMRVFWRVALLQAVLKVIDPQVRLVLFVEEAHDLFFAEGQLHKLRIDSRHFDRLDLPAGGDLVDLESDSDGGRDEVLAVSGDIDRLDGFAHVEDAVSDQLLGLVHANGAIVRAGEEQVSVRIVEDLVDWAGVAAQENWLHRGRHI